MPHETPEGAQVGNQPTGVFVNRYFCNALFMYLSIHYFFSAITPHFPIHSLQLPFMLHLALVILFPYLAYQCSLSCLITSQILSDQSLCVSSLVVGSSVTVASYICLTILFLNMVHLLDIITFIVPSSTFSYFMDFYRENSIKTEFKI